MTLIGWLSAGASVAIVALTTAASYWLFGVNAATAGFAYIIDILLIASVWGWVEALVGSVTAMLCYGYFFLPPVQKFTIEDPANGVALIAFVATALVASHLSHRAKREAQEATARQQETERLYELSRAILLTGITGPIGYHVAQHLARLFRCAAVAIYDPEEDKFYYGGYTNIPDIEADLKRIIRDETDSRTISPDLVVASISNGETAVGSLAMKGIVLSEPALQALLKLVAISLERVRTQAVETRAEAARQSEEFKSTLLDAIAHEFKTPLTAIKGASNVLAETPALDPHVRELVSVIDEEADRLNLLVRDAANMAKIDASKIQLERQPVRVGEFVERALGQFRQRLDGRCLNIDVRDELPSIFADPDLASLALRQVIDNALKYSAPATALEVSADSNVSAVTISVRDSGPGIPETEAARIFERFYRRPSSKSGMPGSGMGLYVAREIIRAHGGDLTVHSRNGSGSDFRLVLPVAGSAS